MMPYALPPAETKLPIQALAKGLFSRKNSFSERLRNHFNTPACALANSARALLYLLFLDLRERSGGDRSEVLMPGYTCYSVAAAAVKANLRVALYDLDPATFQPDMDDVRRKTTSKTLAVVGHHLMGIQTDISALTDIAHQCGAWCIEDSAQLLDAEKSGAGQTMAADYAVYSFGRGKPLPLGKGGALIAQEPEKLDRIASALEAFPRKSGSCLFPFAVQVLAWPRAYWAMEKLPLGLGRSIFDPAFTVFNLAEFYNQLGSVAFDWLARLNQHRRAISKTYAVYFNVASALTGNHAHHQRRAPANLRYPILVQNQKDVGRLIKYGVRKLYPLSLFDLLELKKNLVNPEDKTPGAREIADRLVTLPTHISVDESMALSIARECKVVFQDIKPVKGTHS